MPLYYVKATSCDGIPFMREYLANRADVAEEAFQLEYDDARVERVISHTDCIREEQERLTRLSREMDDEDGEY